MPDKPLYREPKQARARATYAAILEAAARILEEEGERRLTTNRIAERAGVGIATLYQYFPDKRAVLAALTIDQREPLRERTLQLIAEGLEPDRAFIRAFIQAFPGRPRARRIAVKALMQMQPLETLNAPLDHQTILGGPGLSPTERFVVTRAVTAAMRAGVLEEHPGLGGPEFEDALVRLARALS